AGGVLHVGVRPIAHDGRASARWSLGAVVTVLTILVVTDLTTGTERFNLAQGVLGTLTGTAAAISTGSMGFLVQQLGDLAGFVFMAAATTVGAALLWAFLPETKPAKYVD